MKLLKVAAALLCAAGLSAFASTMTATISDTDGTAWANATYTAVLTLQGQSGAVPTISGVKVWPLKVSGSASSSGVITGTFTDTSTLDQKNGIWVFTITPNASSSPVTVSVGIIGASPNLTNNFSSLQAPRFPASLKAFGYIDAEVVNPAAGDTYYNVTLQVLRQWNGTAWTGTGGSGSTVGALPSGATSDFKFLDGSGTTATDISGNHNDATLGTGSQAPTWATTGLSFTSATQQGVSLPATLNSTKTFLFGIYINPLLFNASQPANQYAPLLSSSMAAGAGLTVSYLRSVSAANFDAPNTYAPTLYVNNSHVTSAQNLMSGFTVMAVVCGTGGADKDHLYINGIEVAAYTTQGTSCGTQTSGNFWLGSSNVSPWNASGFNGVFYRFATYSTQLTAAAIQQATSAIFADVQSRGVATSPQPVVQTSPQLYAVGDSITFGLNATTPWPTLLALTNQPAYTITNYGISGITTKATVGSEPNRVAPRCSTISGPSIATVFLGTNEFNTGQGATAAQAWAANVAEIQVLKRAGCKVYVMTMISRGGTDLLGTSNDVDKNNFDALVLANAKSAGADGIIDAAANPFLGADGANAGSTYFNPDLTHPKNAGQALIAAAVSNSLNYYNSIYSISNPNVVTANTYTLLSSDAAVTAAPTGNAAYTMPDCTGPSGETYTISNPQSAFTLSIVGGTSQPINGLATAITIASNSTVTLRDVPNPKSVSGCHWAM